jgi:hypothetical protein
MVMYAAPEGAWGADPFIQRVDKRGAPVNGHRAETSNYGGRPTGLPDPAKLPDGDSVANGVGIGNFVYMPGDMTLSGGLQNPPTVAQGSSLRFANFDAPAQVLHTITACKSPCNRSTGISYPLADGPGGFDSGQLGYGPPTFTPAAQRDDWNTPADLPGGTYTYFCRVHPFMRGSFRVDGPPAAGGGGAKAKAKPRTPWISILSKSLRMDRRGRVPVRVRCNGAGCRGTLQLVSVRGRTVVKLGTARVKVRAGHTARVLVKLSRAKRKLVRQRRKLPVLARARPAAGGATASRTLVLRVPRRR